MSRITTLEDPLGENPPLKTPCYVIPTEYGLVPNVTPDITGNSPLYFSAGDFINTALPKNVKPTTSLGLGKKWVFLGAATDFFNFEEGPNKNGIRVYCRNGSIEAISAENYQKLVEFVQPQGTVSLYSQLIPDSSSRQKNIRTAVAAENAKTYSHTINFAYNLANKTDMGLFVQCASITPELKGEFKVQIEKLNANVPRMIFFDGHPSDVREAVDLGFDLLVMRYPVYLAQHGIALNFDFERGKEGESPGLDVRSRDFEKDHRPIVSDCDCVCCRDHSLSYLHHLLNVHEMLAQTFLVQHNIRHYERYMAHIRNEIAEDKE